MTNTVYLNGEYIPAAEAKLSIFDHGFLYGDGIYETLLWQNKEVQNFASHYARLTRSAELLKLPVPKTAAELQDICQQVGQQNNLSEGRIRISLSRGSNDYFFSDAKAPTLAVFIKPLRDYSQHRQQGVKVVTAPQLQRILPNCKHSSMLPMILGKQLAEEHDAFETIFTDTDGHLLEGTVANIMAIKGNQVWITPSQHVLSGTTQQRVIEQLKDYEVVEKYFTTADLQNIDGFYISNALHGLLPVAQIDHIQLPMKILDISDQ